MQQADFKRFKEMITGVAECYGQAVTAQGIALRFKMLEQFEFPEVEKAALSILASRKYTTMPTPADFLEHLAGGSAEDKAEVEAGKVLDAIKQHGGYNSVVFDDPTTQAVIHQAYGGWVKLCEDCGAEESEKWFRQGFAKSWAAYHRQGQKQYGVLAGRTEIQNTAIGRPEWTNPPRLVGNAEKARAVLVAGEEQQRLAGRAEALALPEGLVDVMRVQ